MFFILMPQYHYKPTFLHKINATTFLRFFQCDYFIYSKPESDLCYVFCIIISLKDSLFKKIPLHNT